MRNFPSDTRAYQHKYATWHVSCLYIMGTHVKAVFNYHTETGPMYRDHVLTMDKSTYQKRPGTWHNTVSCSSFGLMSILPATDWSWLSPNYKHYSDVIMSAMASQITSITIVYSTVYSGADQRKYQSSASLAFELGIHQWPVNSPHKWPMTLKMFPFDDVILKNSEHFPANETRWCPKLLTEGMIRPGYINQFLAQLLFSGENVTRAYSHEVIIHLHTWFLRKFDDLPNPPDTWRNNDAMITSSLCQNDVGDVVWTLWRRYYCVVCPLGSDLCN